MGRFRPRHYRKQRATCCWTRCRALRVDRQGGIGAELHADPSTDKPSVTFCKNSPSELTPEEVLKCCLEKYFGFDASVVADYMESFDTAAIPNCRAVRALLEGHRQFIIDICFDLFALLVIKDADDGFVAKEASRDDDAAPPEEAALARQTRPSPVLRVHGRFCCLEQQGGGGKRR